MHKTLFKIVALSALLASTTACAGTFGEKYDGRHKDLTYSEKKYTVKNSIYMPKVANGGAVLFLPSCPSVQRFNEGDIKNNWVNPLLEQGYVVAITDYNEGRNASRPWNCGKNKHLSQSRLLRDVFNGVQALANVPGVDRNKIFTMGTSLGAMVGATAISNHSIKSAEKIGWATPRAHVALYGGCSYPSATYLTSSVARPVLWMVGTNDVEMGTGCNEWLYNSVIEAQPDSVFVTYKGATHCWDCKQIDGFTKNTYYGTQTYTYDKDVTNKSQEEIFTFFRKFMK